MVYEKVFFILLFAENKIRLERIFYEIYSNKLYKAI